MVWKEMGEREEAFRDFFQDLGSDIQLSLCVSLDHTHTVCVSVFTADKPLLGPWLGLCDVQCVTRVNLRVSLVTLDASGRV